MMIEQEGETVEAAIEAALKKAGLPREKANIEIVAEPKKGFFGLGSSPAKVRITPLDSKGSAAGAAEPGKPAAVSTAVPARTAEEMFVVKFLDTVLEGIGLRSKFRVLDIQDGTQCVEIDCPDSALLIGKKGKNLEALQYLVTIVTGKAGEKGRFLLDAEGYRSRRKNSLDVLAKKVSDEVRKTGRAVSLEPMNSYERRTIHLFLENDPEVMTESTGGGGDRRVVIKPRRK